VACGFVARFEKATDHDVVGFDCSLDLLLGLPPSVKFAHVAILGLPFRDLLPHLLASAILLGHNFGQRFGADRGLRSDSFAIVSWEARQTSVVWVVPSVLRPWLLVLVVVLVAICSSVIILLPPLPFLRPAFHE